LSEEADETGVGRFTLGVGVLKTGVGEIIGPGDAEGVAVGAVKEGTGIPFALTRTTTTPTATIAAMTGMPILSMSRR